MHQDTQKELITSALDMVGSMAREAITRRQESRQMQHQLEQHQELVETRARNSRGRRDSGSVSAEDVSGDPAGGRGGRDPTPSGPNVDFDALIQRTDCAMCQQILREIQSMGPDKRAQGLAEYGMMRRAMEQEGTEEAVREVIQDSEVLSEVTERIA